MVTERSIRDTESLDLQELLRTLVAIKKGDFSVRMPIDQTGVVGKIADTLNDIIELNASMATELDRISTVVGKEGKITQRASLGVARGSWATCVDSVNTLITDLVQPTAETVRVIRAVANGDLSQTIAPEIEDRPLKGEFLQTAQIVNTMVEQLSSFSSEVTRVVREVGTEGKLGVQAEVRGVAGIWKDLTDNVNLMAGNLTGQVRNIAEVATAIANGDLSKQITVDVKGEILELKNTVNTMVDQLNSFASEVTRVAREVGSEGKLGVQAEVRDVAGTWKDLTESVNFMAGNLTAQVRNIAAVTKAVANGDLSKKITVDVKGEILELKDTINVMVDQLSSFASEVTRVAWEVGTEGKLGGQAQVTGVAGTWKDLTGAVNSMAGNLTAQVRGIAKVVTAVANGDLKRKLMLEAKGEIETLADTINEMIDTLATFADQVTTVAREVGIEGKLGGQARVPGAAGTWRDLTDNVNELAANLTTQVRAIAEVAIAVTKGDLTRSIAVEAQGEVAVLKDNINQMIANLRETTQKNTEQDWLKTNLAKFTRMLQGHRDIEAVSKLILSELAPLVSAQHGIFYLMDAGGREELLLRVLSTYAYEHQRSHQFRLGEGLVGQCALDKRRILLTEVPSDYIKISSGLGAATPLNAVVLPVLFEGQVTGVIELASFQRFSEVHLSFLDQLTESIAIVLNTIAASMRTEELLKQSQSLAEELQTQQAELKNQQEQLQQTNAALEQRSELLALQNREVERQNQEIEQARRLLEERAEQLALTSKYKSEFLANMSHELRTPLNSLLILAKLLADNSEGNLTAKQVEYSQTIYGAGTELLGLISDILDLAKIESGTVSINLDQVLLSDLRDQIERTFRQVAQDKQLNFRLEFDPQLPKAIHTDAKRLQQVLKNLLSNAFKFTERGEVRLRVAVVPKQENSSQAETVISFAVSDTGIGIATDKQKVIFEAFQQADGTTSRKYGGTGLGLSISREIAQLLGGEIQLVSTPGQGSTFTLYLPQGSGGGEDKGKEHYFTTLLPHPIAPDYPSLANEQETPQSGDLVLTGKKVLIVDDDMRNIFALTSLLERQQMQVLFAENGADALVMLQQHLDVNVVLMDVMMPEMDGYETMRAIRQDARFSTLPMLALTAKAMQGDREKCIAAGASDYITKPVDTEQLLSLLRVWLYQ